jgi:hypothetical protein
VKASGATRKGRAEITLKSHCVNNRTYYVQREGVEDCSLWLIMFSPIRSLNLSVPTDCLAACATFDMVQGKMTPRPFILTLTPQYVAREIKKALPVSYLRVQRYAERKADKLKAIAKYEREHGSNTRTLE